MSYILIYLKNINLIQQQPLFISIYRFSGPKGLDGIDGQPGLPGPKGNIGGQGVFFFTV